MKVIELSLLGAYVIEPVVHGDHRGFFMESYNEQKLQEHGISFNLCKTISHYLLKQV